jgi:predicted metal-dependent phosphoesterase TrpH
MKRKQMTGDADLDREAPAFAADANPEAEFSAKASWSGQEPVLMDTHVHTQHSDGAATIQQVEEACRRLDVGCCIADHNEIRGSIHLWERRQVPTLTSMEVGSRELIELIVFFDNPESCEQFFKENVEPYRLKRWYTFLPRSLEALMAGAHEHGALISLPHPYAWLWKNIRFGERRQGRVERVLEEIEGIEVLNGSMSPRANRRAWQLCSQLAKTPLAGSDAHLVEAIGSVLVGLEAPGFSASLFDQLKAGRVFGLFAFEPWSLPLASGWQMVRQHTRKLISLPVSFKPTAGRRMGWPSFLK